jgi:hypothetical protein
VVLAEKDVREMVRRTVKQKAAEFHLEYQVLQFLVGDEVARTSSRDIIMNSSACAFIEVYEKIRERIGTQRSPLCQRE